MARISIEECWWTDPRRSKLIKLMGGDEERADGAAVRMWRLAQEFWKTEGRSVPLKIFETLEHAEALLGAGLAVLGECLDEKVIYVCGSSQWLDWAREQKEKNKASGSKGGKKSALRPRNARGQLLKADAKVQAPAKREPRESKPSDSDSGSLVVVVGENEKNAVQRFEDRFHPDAQSILEYLDLCGIRPDLKRYLSQIITRFENFEGFKEFIDKTWAEPSDNPKTYVIVAVKRQIGVLSETGPPKARKPKSQSTICGIVAE